MMNIVALGVTSSVLGLFAASPVHACGGCGGGGGGSCGMTAAPVATASSKASRTYSYQPSSGMYRPQMMMRGGMMGGGSGNSVPRSAGAKAAGN
jgi:hypothetical protein